MNSAFYQVKHKVPLCGPTTRLPSYKAYLQLAMPFTFTQMPSFWQGFGSHGSLKYGGQLWSSKGPVLSADRFFRLGCPLPWLPGKIFSKEACAESSFEACCSWPWRTRPWGDSLVFLGETSVLLR